MSLLNTIQRGTANKPPRFCLVGVQGIGKSTLAADMPNPVFIPTEEGLNQIDCAKFPQAKSFEDVMEAIRTLISEKHDFQTVVIDTIDWLERLIWVEVCKDKTASNINDIGYARGFEYAIDYWRKVLDALDCLREKHGMLVMLTAHAKIEKFHDPETEPYDRFSPRLHKHAAAVVQEWCDVVLFATYKVSTKQTDQGFNKTRQIGKGTGKRVLRTEERPSHIGKNRFGMPYEIELAKEGGWAAILNAMTGQATEQGESRG